MSAIERLNELGFDHVGQWRLRDKQLSSQLDAKQNAAPVLYAFVKGQEVLYVGKSSRTLSNRLYGYSRPGPTQKTNVRLNQLIIEQLIEGSQIEIYAFDDPDPTERAGFLINMPAALEDDIIRQLQPAWNSSGVVGAPAESKPASSKSEVPKPVSSAADEDSRLKPTFLVQIGKTYFRQGFFNVPVDFARYFGRHGQEIEIQLSGVGSAWGTINRTVNSNDTPRIMGGVKVRDWFASTIKLGDRVKITVASPQKIVLARP